MQDLRYAARSLARTPGFTVAAIIALALGIGANSAILSVVSGVLLKPLPYAQPERLVTVLGKGYGGLAPGNFLEIKRQLRSFSQLGAAEYWTPAITGVAEPEKIYSLRLSSDVLPMLGIRPALGRVWTAAEDVTGREREIVIGHGLWVRRFASDSNVLGKSVILDGSSYTVIGVMPRGFAFAPFWATRAELWAPLALDARAGDHYAGSLRVFARLKPGATIEAAQSEVSTVASQLERLYPGTSRDVRVTDLTTQVVGKVRTPLLIILGAVGFVLLIACANVAHMLLARAARRQREIAVRVAIGASRARIIAQLLTESVLLAAVGGIAGLALAEVGVRVLATQGASSIPRAAAISLDARVLLATAFITLLTGIAFGLVPALSASSTDLTSALKEGERGSTEGRKNRTRSMLIASEFALALMLLVGAGLLIRSFAAMQSLNPGYDPANVLTMVVPVTGTSSSPEGKRAAFYDALLAKIRAMPGVRSASAVNHIPIGGDDWGIPFRVEGRPEPRPQDVPSASYKVVMPGYFTTMRIPLLAGRDVNADDKIGAPRVVVVNEFLAKRHWPGENPLGKRISFGVDAAGARTWATVVGVVHNTIHGGDWTAPANEETFLPFAQQRNFLANPEGPYAYMSFAVRADCGAKTNDCDPTALVPGIRSALRELDPNVPLSEVQTMSSLVDGATARERFYLMLLTAFATVAVALAAVGIYGVMSYAVSRRTHELGLRMALGARPRQLLVSVVRDGMTVAAIGGAFGIAGALAISRMMASLLYGVKATDPLTFVAVASMLGVIALVACYIPARRATKIDPLAALRGD